MAPGTLVAYFYGCGDNPNYPGRFEYPGNGPFDKARAYKVGDIRDGTSNTIFFGERSRFINDPSSVFNFWTTVRLWNSGGTLRPSGFSFPVPKINANWKTPLWFDTELPPGTSDDSDYKAWVLTDAIADQYRDYGQWGFGSLHPGGANFLFGDGSVKFLKETIAGPTYRALGTRAGNETISADAI